MILFCLPYAGGSEVIYFKWKQYLQSYIKLHPVALKGRGTRIEDGFYESLIDAVEDVYFNIKHIIQKEDYAIFGHSMGSLIAYELYYKIVDVGARKPQHIFFSGYKSPCLERRNINICNMQDDDLIRMLIKMGGIPKGF